MAPQIKDLDPLTEEEILEIDNALLVVRSFIRALTGNLNRRYGKDVYEHGAIIDKRITILRQKLTDNIADFCPQEDEERGLEFLECYEEFFAETLETDKRLSSSPGFLKWLISQRRRNDPTGDVARDAYQDIKDHEQAGKSFPATSYRSLKEYIENRGGCDGALCALDVAFIEFQNRNVR